MIDKFTIKELLGLLLWMEFFTLGGVGYVIYLAKEAEKDRKIIYQALKRIAGDMPN